MKFEIAAIPRAGKVTVGNYNAKQDTFMGGVLMNLGYITPAQREKAEVLDSVAKTLQANNPEFKKPFYGQIASGAGAERILQELNQQVAAGKIKADDPQKLKLDDLGAVELGIKGEQAGSDVERKGGPIDNALKVQKELRDMEKLGMLPDSAEAMRDMSVKIAERLNLDVPARNKDHAFDSHRDVEQLFRSSTEQVAQRQVEAPERRLS